MTFELLIGIINWLGIVVFAISGVIEARKKKLDLFGTYAVAFITAYGGGTLRDVMLGRVPVGWTRDDTNLIFTGLIATIAFVTLPRLKIPAPVLDIPDALGIGLFGITGTTYALQAGTPPLVAVLIGVITASFGGVLRDMIVNEVPNVFRRGQLYATAAFAGSAAFVLLNGGRTDSTPALLIGVTVTFTLRVLALRYNIRLPSF